MKRMTSFLERLLAIQSPVGYCDDAIAFVDEALGDLPVKRRRTASGALHLTWPGSGRGPARAVTGHVDTIGLCVKSIKPSGRLSVSAIGGVIPFTVEGEYCTVRPLTGQKPLRGTVMPCQASIHVHRDLGEFKHTLENLEVRLDAPVSSEADVRKLGVDAGDLVLVDTRTEVTEGWVKSRYLDDKAGVAAILGALWLMAARKQKPAVDTHVLVAVAEETGYGASAGLPPEVAELLVVDMGAVGPGQYSDERAVSICMKDSAGPYDGALIKRLLDLAKKRKVRVKRDIYPYYGSDRSSFLHGGGDGRVALVGPGVDASHAWERTHVDALTGTAELVAAWLVSKP